MTLGLPPELMPHELASHVRRLSKMGPERGDNSVVSGMNAPDIDIDGIPPEAFIDYVPPVSRMAMLPQATAPAPPRPSLDLEEEREQSIIHEFRRQQERNIPDNVVLLDDGIAKLLGHFVKLSPPSLSKITAILGAELKAKVKADVAKMKKDMDAKLREMQQASEPRDSMSDVSDERDDVPEEMAPSIEQMELFDVRPGSDGGA